MKIIFVVFIVIMLSLLFISGCQQQAQVQNQKTKISEQALVTRVVDGDTVKVGNESIRMLGINAPEKGEKCYQEAKDNLAQLENKTVYLEKTSEDKDKYKRYLRFIYLGSNESESVNLMMIKRGLVVAYFPSENTLHKLEFIEAEKQAIENRVGCLWQDINLTSCITIDSFKYNAEGDDCMNPADEYVAFRNICDDINMSGWQVSDTGRHRYDFNLTFKKNTVIILRSGFGQDSFGAITELYWKHKDTCPAIWDDQGDTLYMRDNKGNLVLYYRY